MWLICSLCILVYMPRAKSNLVASSNVPSNSGCNKRRNVPVMHKALQRYLYWSCCYITVSYPVATTNANAGLFLAHTTAVAAPLFLTSPVYPVINMTYITQCILVGD